MDQRTYQIGDSFVQVQWYRINPRSSVELALYNVFVYRDQKLIRQEFDQDSDQVREIRNQYQSEANRRRRKP